MSSLRETTIGTYVEDVSSSSPTPGGGSVTAFVGALAASLGAMVAEIATANRSDSSFDAWNSACQSHRERLLQLCIDDENAFGTVMACLKRPKDDPARASSLQTCLKAAADVPLETARACLDVLRTLEPMVPLASKHSVSDVGVAAQLALAAARASLFTIEVNRVAMTDAQAAAELGAAAERVEAEAAEVCRRIADQVISRIRG
jgi:formiminotetrahydrofolate cyclodeaminase